MQPAHPGDSSLRPRRRRRSPSATSRSPRNTDGPLDAETLAGADVLVIAHPSDPKWEATVNGRLARCSSDRESTRSRRFVRGGGGLIVLGETEQDKYGNNLNDLLARFGIADRERHRPGLRAPLGDARPGCSPTLDHATAARPRPTSLARVDAGLLLPRRHPGARTTAPA